MIELWYGLLAVAGGVLAGGIFFGGLWWTVRRIPHSDRPALLILGSMGVRLLLSMAVFYAIMALTHHIVYLAIAVAVFVVVRVVLTNRIRPKKGRKRPAGKLVEGELHATES